MWKSIRATTREGLAEIQAALRYCKIDMDSARIDGESRTLVVDIEVANFEEAKSVWNLYLFSRRRIPVRAGMLAFRDVRRFTAEDRARIGPQSFRKFTADDEGRRLRVEMIQNGDIFVDVDSIDVQLDVADPIVRWSGVTWIFPVESGEF